MLSICSSRPFLLQSENPYRLCGQVKELLNPIALHSSDCLGNKCSMSLNVCLTTVSLGAWLLKRLFASVIVNGRNDKSISLYTFALLSYIILSEKH